MTRHYRNSQGRYVGAFDGNHGIDLTGFIEAPAPSHGSDIWDDDAGVWAPDPAVTAQGIKDECSMLILDRVDEKDQRNLAARSVLNLTSLRDGDLSADTVTELEGELSVINGISNWIQAMKEECRRAIADGDDPEWPAWDEDWNDLVDLV